MTHVLPIPRIEFKPLREIEDPRQVGLIYSGTALDAVKDRLPNLDVVWQKEVVEATEEAWQPIVATARGEAIYAVGGGLAVDAAKYVAARTDVPLISLPTALSVDAFLTWASGVRRDGSVCYLETKCPDLVVVDYDLLSQGPPEIRAAGICDVLSIATAAWDWKYAQDQGKQPDHMPFLPYAYDVAQNILEAGIDCADSAGRGEPAGLSRLLDCLVLEVQLCNRIGHSRPEEGSEHYFAYAAENSMGQGLPHGHLVGPGIVVMAGLQGQDVKPLRDALEACHIPLTTVSRDVILETLKELPDYCHRHSLPYGIAHTLSEARLEDL
jgi:glycerol-1-phosphate dehydrogenase [NAD(P)+]